MERENYLGLEGAKQFMTSEEYRDWSERFYEKVKPELDKQMIARLNSWKDSMNHFVR